VRWEGHVARMRDEKCTQKFSREASGEETTWGTQERWNDNIKMNLNSGVDREQCRALMNTAMNPPLVKMFRTS
jgi:hypothetical protein